jgi:hypothetical protein
MISSLFLGTLVMLLLLHPVEQTIYAASVPTSGYSHGCSDAQILDPAGRYLNQPNKGPSFHNKQFMEAYNEGFIACSPNSSNSKCGNIQAVGEVNSNATNGLKIMVHIGSSTESHPARINITSSGIQTGLCYDFELTRNGQPITFFFNRGIIPDGKQFRACLTLLDLNATNCANGVNHYGSLLESIFLTNPTSSIHTSEGFQVYVNLTHNGQSSVKLCIKSANQDLGCNVRYLSTAISPIRIGPFSFKPGAVNIGQKFTACVEDQNTGEQNCSTDARSSAKQVEQINLSVPNKLVSPLIPGIFNSDLRRRLPIEPHA